MDIMLGDGSSNSIEKELDNVINRADRHQDFEYLPNRRSSTQENDIRIIDNKNCPVRQDGLAESIEILLSEMNARLTHERDSLLNVIHAQTLVPLVQL